MKKSLLALALLSACSVSQASNNLCDIFVTTDNGTTVTYERLCRNGLIQEDGITFHMTGTVVDSETYFALKEKILSSGGIRMDVPTHYGYEVINSSRLGTKNIINLSHVKKIVEYKDRCYLTVKHLPYSLVDLTDEIAYESCGPLVDRLKSLYTFM